MELNKNPKREYDYQGLWNVLIQTLEGTIEYDENELDVDFGNKLYGLLDATRVILKDEEDEN